MSGQEKDAGGGVAFCLNVEERKMLDPNYKKPRRKPRPPVASSASLSAAAPRSRLHSANTKSWRLKQRAPASVDDIVAAVSDDASPGRGHKDADEESEPDALETDPTYQLACAHKAARARASVSGVVANSRRMFLLQYSLNVQQDEKQRLERELREGDEQLQKSEAELRLAQQAFDQFLQENDRKAMAAQKRAEAETHLRLEKTLDIKAMDDRILALRREINKLRDILAEYTTFETFLFSLSPEAWRIAQQSQSASISAATHRDPLQSLSLDKPQSPQPPPEIVDLPVVVEAAAAAEDTRKSLEATAVQLGFAPDEVSKMEQDVKLYFREPQQLLGIFADLEDENLRLIQKCQEAEDRLEVVRRTTREAKAALDQQTANFENDIKRLESDIASETLLLAKLEAEGAVAAATTASTAPAAAPKKHQPPPSLSNEDRTLAELERLVSATQAEVAGGEARAALPTIDKLKRIELRMETLTQQLEKLPQEKVKIAQRTCERQRREREEQHRMEEHRRMLAERNQRALDRALAPPFVKPEVKRSQRRASTSGGGAGGLGGRGRRKQHRVRIDDGEAEVVGGDEHEDQRGEEGEQQEEQEANEKNNADN